MGLHFSIHDDLGSSPVLSYGNFGGALRLGPALNFFPPFVLLRRLASVVAEAAESADAPKEAKEEA